MTRVEKQICQKASRQVTDQVWAKVVRCHNRILKKVLTQVAHQVRDSVRRSLHGALNSQHEQD